MIEEQASFINYITEGSEALNEFAKEDKSNMKLMPRKYS